MKKQLIKTISLALMLLAGSEVYAITAPEIFTDGKRAFDNGRWQECEEVLSRFLETWPDHKLKSEALFYKTISSTRNYARAADEQLKKAANDWNVAMASLTVELPGRDLTELEVAIRIAGGNPPETWEAIKDLSPVELKHYLARSWHPDPTSTPLETLKWSTSWLKKHTSKSIEPELSGKISLLRCKAMWNFLLSPLSIHANSNILKVCGYWPVHTCFEKELQTGFDNGDPAVKREIAFLGYHYDFFRNRGVVRSDVTPLNSRWYTYLSERGINLQEAWCPR